MEFYTLGVYGRSEQQFLKELTENGVDTFCDIRQRRAVRGSTYSFVNSTRLQDILKEVDISYVHVKDLAPTAEIRNIQKKIDEEIGTQKRDRSVLNERFISEYDNIILSNFNFDLFFSQLSSKGAKKIALFCVEASYQACHRSIVAKKIKADFGLSVTHL